MCVVCLCVECADEGWLQIAQSVSALHSSVQQARALVPLRDGEDLRTGPFADIASLAPSERATALVAALQTVAAHVSSRDSTIVSLKQANLALQTAISTQQRAFSATHAGGCCVRGGGT